MKVSQLFSPTSITNPDQAETYFLQIDNRFPELILQFVEIPHANLPEVSRMVFVDICPVVVLSTCHTATTGMLAMLAYTAVAGGYVAATVKLRVRSVFSAIGEGECGLKIGGRSDEDQSGRGWTYCFLVFVNRVGILIDVC